MKYQIDQSGKIEQTNKDTVVSVANENNSFAVILKNSDKIILQTIFRSSNKKRFFAPLVFSAVTAWAIKVADVSGVMIIDKEYSGYEKLIMERVSEYLKNLKSNRHIHLEFGHVGKLTIAHNFALEVAHKKKKANKKLSLEDISKLVIGIKNDRNLNASRPRSV